MNGPEGFRGMGVSRTDPREWYISILLSRPRRQIVPRTPRKEGKAVVFVLFRRGGERHGQICRDRRREKKRKRIGNREVAMFRIGRGLKDNKDGLKTLTVDLR